MPHSRAALTSCICLLLGLSASREPVGAQLVTVSGRVDDRLRGLAIGGATVELGGVGSRVTNDTGGFRLANVPPGSYTLTVRALGYVPGVVQLVLRADTTLVIALDVDPFQLDSLGVRGRFVTVRGRLVEPTTGRPILDGALYATRNRSASTNTDGRFQFNRVPAGVPFEIRTYAFAYESVLARFTPERDTTLVIELAVDTMIQRLIGRQEARLEQRMVDAVGQGYSISRERLLKAPGNTLAQALSWIMATAPYSQSRGTVCVFVDEMPIAENPSDLLLPEEIERVEFVHGGAGMRIYTRRFMARMISDTTRLARPSYSQVPRGMRGQIGPAFCR